MKSTHQSYREYLQEAYRCAVERNRAYSLRAFARDIGLSPSRLSEILKGKDSLSKKSATRVAVGLGLPDDQADYFVTLVVAQSSRSPADRKIAEARLTEWEKEGSIQITFDCIHALNQWQHFALLELIRIVPPRKQLPLLAKKLGLSTIDVEAFLERLERLGLVERLSSDGWRPVSADFRTPSDVPDATLRNYQHALLNLAIESLKKFRHDEREVASALFSASVDDLPEMKKDIRKFRKSMMRKYETDGSKLSESRAVFCLGTQLFPVSESVTEKELM